MSQTQSQVMKPEVVDREAGLKATADMFAARLLRKAYRPEKRQGCPPGVFECEEEFMKLVAVAEETQPMDRSTWHGMCNEFSDKWEHICHWVHPSRLADFLTENLGSEWEGEYPARPATKEKAKVKSNVKAQRFLCTECNVVCNSYSQYTIHAEGSRHKECLEMKIRSEAAKGVVYESPGAIGLDLPEDADRTQGSTQQQAYYKRKEEPKEPATKSFQYDPYVWPQPPAAHSHSYSNSVAAKAKLFAVTSMLAMAGMGGNQQNMSQNAGYEYFEPTKGDYNGLYWGNTECFLPHAEPAQQYTGEVDDEEEDQEAAAARPSSKLNPNATAFMSRSMTLPAYNSYDDLTATDDATSETTSSAESTIRSAFSEAHEDEIAAAEALIRLALMRDNVVGLEKELKAFEHNVVSAAFVKACEASNPARLSEVLATMPEEVKEAVGADIRSRLSEGIRVLELSNDPTEEEVAFSEEVISRESVSFSAVMALAVHLFIEDIVSVEFVNTAIALYMNGVSSGNLNVGALEVASAAFARLASKFTSLEVPTTGFAVDALQKKAASEPCLRRLTPLVNTVIEAAAVQVA